MSTELVENITAATGNASESKRLHEQRVTSAVEEEPFHRDLRATSGMKRKLGVYSSILGCCTASSILAWRRALLSSSSSSSSSPSNFQSRLSLGFFDRYLVTPICVPLALSIGFVLHSSVSFEREFRIRERQREEWELDNFRDGEKAEMVRIYEARGLTEEQATQVVDIISRNDKFFIDTMMTDELGFSPVEPMNNADTLRAAALTSCSFLATCVPPLLAAFLSDGNSNSNSITDGGVDSRHLIFRYIPEGVLAWTSLAASLLQTRMLLRAYARGEDRSAGIKVNLAYVGAMYACSFFGTKFF